MLISVIKNAISFGEYDGAFARLYGKERLEEQKARFSALCDDFLARYGDLDGELYSVPGRTEISGNHTDHNHGKVLAASVDIDVVAVAAKTDDGLVRLKSVGHDENVVDLNRLKPGDYERGNSSAIVAGICDAFRNDGRVIGGFRAVTASDVLTGSGLSSSAAFEVLCGKILSCLYNGDGVEPMKLAIAGQYAENVFFGKPCGLMDQAACACGGFLFIDFADPKAPETETLQFDPEEYGYTFCIVNTGGNHADLTEDYASVPKEMKAVAAALGKDFLRDCTAEALYDNLPIVRKEVGDRAILRAIHFFDENERVEAQKKALEAGDAEAFFAGVQKSGKSSFEFLQNVYSSKNVSEQGLSLALALTERFDAICRVHGGGFAGTIQAYVPKKNAEAYKARIDGVFGDGACMMLHIRPVGATKITPQR